MFYIFFKSPFPHPTKAMTIMGSFVKPVLEIWPNSQTLW